MNLRQHIAITLILLVLTLFCVAFTARSTVVTWQQFRKQNALAKSGDVRTIGPWMTLPYVAHTYQVPETYLYSQLKLPNTPTLHHTTLHLLALHYHRPVDALVGQVASAVNMYRKQHPLPSHPVSGINSVLVGRKTL